MAELVCNVPVPETPQELDQAVQNYRVSSLSGTDLFCHWQAIREASLRYEAQVESNSLQQGDSAQVPGEDSY